MENKIITIYELMGLIKDGKAPKKIKYDGIIYAFDKELNDYYNSDRKIWSFLYHRLGKAKNCINDFLNDTVEILPEENDEWEDVEKINVIKDENCKRFIEYDSETGHHKYTIRLLDEYFSNKINQLIKNQKILKEKLENKDGK